jgi:hypothetical protein
MESMFPIQLSLPKNMALVFDQIFDSFDQNEPEFTNVCVRILIYFSSCLENDAWNEIHEKIQTYNEDPNAPSDERYEREILLTDQSYRQIKALMKEYEYEGVENIFATGVILIHTLREHLRSAPRAELILVGNIPIRVAELLSPRPHTH